MLTDQVKSLIEEENSDYPGAGKIIFKYCWSDQHARAIGKSKSYISSGIPG